MKKTGKNFDSLKTQYSCEYCNFICSQKCDWERHITRQKHIRNTGNTKKLEKNFKCVCEKVFKSNSGLWKHQKICAKIQPLTDEKNIKHPKESDSLPEPEENTEQIAIPKDINYSTILQLIMMLVKDNNEFKNIIHKENTEFKSLMIEQNAAVLEIAKNSTQTIPANNTANNSHNTNTNSNNTNSNNTNSNNTNTFNLQFFLNETCKDAMNIGEFIENIKISVEDIENMGRLGFVGGMSNILIKNLHNTDITKRPIHCTDQKRCVIHIKDNNVWEKDDNNLSRTRLAIRRVSNKNIKVLPAYREKYKGCESSDSRYSDVYNKMITEVMGGKGDNDVEKQDKIIGNLVKKIGIDKQKYVDHSL
jgi:hypothetical protein